MSDQLDLFGSGGGKPPDLARPAHAKKPPQARKRKPFKLFFAIRPDGADAAELSKRGDYLDRQYGIKGRPLKPDRLHITLHVIGEYDELPQSDVLDALKAGDAMIADAFDVVFDRAMTFIGPAAYVLRVGEGSDRIENFWEKLRAEIDHVRPFKKQPFTPHMTLSYSGKTMTEHAIEPIRWTAREFVLINSHVGKTHHEVLGRWLLRA